MNQYVLKGSKNGECTFCFNQDNTLVKFEASPMIDADALNWLLQRLPLTLASLQGLATAAKLQLAEVPIDLSFERFWQEYDHKMGSKARVQKAWEKLEKADKVKALVVIPLYNRYLKVKATIEKVYPETYLNQRRFENSYKE